MSEAPPLLGVVLAAGRGARLGTLTIDRSKAMLPVAGRPMVGRVLQMLVEGGCDHFIVVVHPSDRDLMRYLARTQWRTLVRTVEQPERLGMVHAVECAGPLIAAEGAQEFVLASCDNVYPDGHVSSLIRERRMRELDAAVTLLRVAAAQIPTLAVVDLREGLIRTIVEKPRVEDAPSNLGVPSLHALSARILDCLTRVPVSARGEREFPDALQVLIEDGGRVGGVVTSERLTLTRPKDLIALNCHFLNRDPGSAVLGTLLPHATEIIHPVRIEDGVLLGAGCRLGPMAVLERACRVGAGSVVKNSVVLRGGVVEAGDMVEDRVVV